MNLRFSGRYFLRISLKFGTNLSCLQFKLEKVLWSKEHVDIINTFPPPKQILVFVASRGTFGKNTHFYIQYAEFGGPNLRKSWLHM